MCTQLTKVFVQIVKMRVELVQKGQSLSAAEKREEVRSNELREVQHLHLELQSELTSLKVCVCVTISELEAG